MAVYKYAVSLLKYKEAPVKEAPLDSNDLYEQPKLLPQLRHL